MNTGAFGVQQKVSKMNLEHCSHHPLDAEFIAEQLGRIDFSMGNRITAAYSKRFNELLSDETIKSYKRMNTARKECNSRLRAAVANLNTTYQPVMR